MSRVSGSIPSLIQGVSQQHATARLPSQAELIENAILSPADGLMKRPGSTWIKRLRSFTVPDPDGYRQVHFIERDEEEKYVVVFENQSIRVFDLEGTSIPFVDNGFLPYLDTLKVNENVQCFTVADTTFVLNRKKKAVMEATDTADAVNEALVWVRGSEYKCAYTVRLNGTSYGYETQDHVTTPAAAEADIQTSNVATEIATSLGGAAGFTITAQGNCIHITKADGSSFNIRVHDDRGNTLMSLIANGTVQRFSDLPPYAKNDMIVKVAGNPETATDDYWVKFQTIGSNSFGQGEWIECPKPGTTTTIDPDSMPHILVRRLDADGSITGTIGDVYFSFEQPDWNDRLVGSDTTNPIPSFIGQTLDDICLFRGRLALVSKGNITLSRANDLYNFFRKTSLTLADDDPIDIDIATRKTVSIRWAVPMGKTLCMFGDSSQLVIPPVDSLTPKTVRIDVVGNFDVEPMCRPIAVEDTIYFAFRNGDYTGIREWYVEESTEKFKGTCITTHVPKYLPGHAYRMANCSAENTLVVACSGDTDSLYVYRYLWNGNEKVQSAWSKWTFDAVTSFWGFDFIDSKLYFTATLGTATGKGLELEVLDISPGRADSPLAYSVPIDNRLEEGSFVKQAWTVGGVSGCRISSITPNIFNGTPKVIRRGNDGNSVLPLTVHSTTTSEIFLQGTEALTANIVVGNGYTMTYEFSPFFLRKSSPYDGVSAITTGRLQLDKLYVNYEDSGRFRVSVTPTGKAESLYFQGGGTALGTGRFPARIGAENTKVVIKIEDLYTQPARISSAEWVGRYSAKHRSL